MQSYHDIVMCAGFALLCSLEACKPVQQVLDPLLRSSGPAYEIMLAKLLKPTQLAGSHHSNSLKIGPPPLHKLVSFAISMRMIPSLISSTMYTTAMQQLEGSRQLGDWNPVRQVSDLHCMLIICTSLLIGLQMELYCS
jgi:hypothetical protein